jgi:hypothetical protein
MKKALSALTLATVATTGFALGRMWDVPDDVEGYAVVDSVTLEVLENGNHVRLYPRQTDAANAAQQAGGNAQPMHCTIAFID